jgi:L,D-transpeptidase catalytic domain
MTPSAARTGGAALTAAATVLVGASPAAAIPHNPAPGSPVRVERANGANATVVAGPGSSVGLRASFDAPTDGATTAEVRVARDGKITHRYTVPLVAKDGKATIAMPIRAKKVGIYRVGVRVSGRLVGDVVEFDAIPRTLNSGSPKRSISMAQAILSRHAYVVGSAGQFDARTGRALVAARKRLGLARTPTWDATLAGRLARGEGDFPVRFKGHGRHVEADLSLQILALIGANGKVERIYPTSSGKPSTPTILGSFSVYRKDLGTNAKGMVNSSYFIRGYAIHGYAQVPTYNASHGCLRVPVPDALSIFNWVRYGTKVDVYR